MDSVNENYTQEYQETETNFSEIIGNYLKYWKWILLSLILAVIAGFFYVKSQIPVYKIQTDILIKDNKQGSETDILTQLNLNPSNIVIDNEIQVLKSRGIAERAVAALDLQISYYSKDGISKKVLYNSVPVNIKLIKPSKLTYGAEYTIKWLNNSEILFNGKNVPLNSPVLTDAGLILITPTGSGNKKDQINVVFKTVSDVAEQYLASMTVASVTKLGTVLTITTEDAVPQRGADYLNQLVKEYNKASVEDKNRNISNTLSFIKDRLDALVVELNSSEKKVQDYKATNRITDISAQASLFFNNVSSVDEQLNKVQLQLTVLKNIEAYLHTPDASQVKLPSLLGVEDPTVASLVQQLGEAQSKKASVLRTIPESNPIVSSINDQIISLKQALSQTIQSLRASLMISQRQLQAQTKRYEADIRTIPAKERGLLDVMREQSIKNTLFNFLLQKREETAMSLASTTPDSRVINDAKSTNYPIKPVKSSLYLIFIALGLAVPLGIIFLKESLNNKVRKKSEIEGLTKVPVLAQISKSTDIEPLVTISKPRSMVAEQIRALRTNLEFIVPETHEKVILFTSSVSGEGKSYVSLNLCASLAITGKKVIILELDLRKPKLLSTLGMESRIGLSDYLIGKANITEITRSIPNVDNFFMIESGSIPPNPAELLVNGRLTGLIEELKKTYDYILLDAPPVGLVTDAQILSRYANATFFIIRFNFTLKDHIRSLNEIYRKKIFKNINIVFNSIEDTGFGYGYNYNYGYYEESGPKKSWINRLFSGKK